MRVSVTPQLLFTPGKDPVPMVQEAVWASGPVWTGAENLVLTGIRSPDRPARRQSLYRLSYPANTVLVQSMLIMFFLPILSRCIIVCCDYIWGTHSICCWVFLGLSSFELILYNINISNMQKDTTDADIYYCKFTLHVSGIYRTHHQEYIKL